MSDTRVLTVSLETVTPMFLGGAEPREAPELRPPSVRGALRYWFRAGLGGVTGNDWRKVRGKEVEIFGSADKQGGMSSVWVRLTTPDFDKNYRQPVLPHRDETWRNHQGRELKNFPQPAIPPGTEPILTLTLKPGAPLDNLEMATWSLLLWLTLGGLGRRSRRGFGSMRIKSVETLAELNGILVNNLAKAQRIAGSREALAERISKLLADSRAAFEQFTAAPPENPGNLPKFSLLAPDTKIVVWSPPSNSPSDYTTALTPLMRQLSRLMAQNDRQFAEAFGGYNPRRASPLWVSAHRLEKEWALVLTFLKAEWLEKKQGRQHNEVVQFLDSLSPRCPVSPIASGRSDDDRLAT